MKQEEAAPVVQPKRLRPHPLDVLLLGAPIAILAKLFNWGDLTLFFASGLAIVPLARYIGMATEELAGHVGSAAGGLLNATFGNATELIISYFALRAGHFELVKASLIGSILGNVLAVLGLSFLLGGWRREQQRFNTVAARAGGSQLALAAGALLVPAVLAATAPIKEVAVYHLSMATALVLLAAYAAGLMFSLRTHAHLFTEEQETEIHGRRWSVRRSVLVLLISTLVVAVLSELLVEGVKGVTSQLGWSEVFVGVILVALLGNAAEHASAVTAAQRDDMDLALSIAVGSATQIALFVAPVLVVLGALIGRPIDLLFSTFEVAGVAIGVALVNLVINDGESNWLEGVQLLAIYAILGAAFFVYP
ncbi:MAG: Calcium/proton exchanger [Chloroflexi bacterium]|jgi:Ca2+:H+ antiporter|nr:Calcium/proton exchanger [Chloroflexota bacterium]